MQFGLEIKVIPTAQDKTIFFLFRKIPAYIMYTKGKTSDKANHINLK